MEATQKGFWILNVSRKLECRPNSLETEFIRIDNGNDTYPLLLDLFILNLSVWYGIESLRQMAFKFLAPSESTNGTILVRNSAGLSFGILIASHPPKDRQTLNYPYLFVTSFVFSPSMIRKIILLALPKVLSRSAK